MRMALFTIYIMVAMTSFARLPEKYRLEQLPDGIILFYENFSIKVQVCSTRIFHIVCVPDTKLPDDSILVVAEKIGPSDWKLERKGQTVILRTSEISVEINTATILCRFLDATGAVALEEKERAFSPTVINGTQGWNSFETFKLSSDEGIYGLGQHQNGWMNHRGKEVTLVQTHTTEVNPILVSTKGWGILWNNYSKTYFRDDRNGATFWSEHGDKVDYFVFFGRDMDQVIDGYRDATVATPMLGKWAYGFWQSKGYYSTAKELTDVAAEYRMRRLPLDAIVQDRRDWGETATRSSKKLDYKVFPETVKSLELLHNPFHIHYMISIWPVMKRDTMILKELSGKGFTNEPVYRSRERLFEADSSETREIFWNYLDDGLMSKGVDGQWIDINASYNVLRRNICSGLNLSASGIPYWTTDIGGFFITGHDNGSALGRYSGGCKNPSYKELYIRWFQFGSFCPIFRSNGTQYPREVWQFGDIGDWGYDAMTRFLNLRYRLLPYIYSVAWKVTSEGSTMIRPLAMDFSADKKVYNLVNEYLFGSSILVCPVTEEQYFPLDTLLNKPCPSSNAASINVYLPKSTRWIDFWTGEQFEGGENVQRETPINILPLFIRAGSIIPMGPILQFTDEKAADPIELRIYPGADGSFTLFEDEGDSYRYKEGKFATIGFSWNDMTGALTIGERKGTFPGMLQLRTFRIVIVSPGHGTGVEITPNPDKVVQYYGGNLIIKP